MSSSELDVLEELASLPTMAHPTVSPDGTEVGLYYDVTGRNELHVLDVETGELSRWSDGEVPRNARWFVDWAAGGDRVFFHVDDAGNEQNDVHALTRDGEHEVVVEMGGQTVINDLGSRGETLLLGSSRDGQMNVYRHDLPTGETTKLTEFQRAAGGATISPDGDRFAFATNESDDFDNRDVYLADVDGSNQRNLELGEDGAESGPADWGPDGERLLVSDNTPDVGRAGVYDVAADEVRWLGDGAHEEGAVSFVDGRVVLTHTTPTTRTELLAYDLGTDEYETLVEAEYGPFEPADFADAEYITFESDGVPDTPQAAVEHDPYDTFEIGGLFYDSSERPSPLVVNPHGGPRARDSKRFDLYTQVLVSQGYSVLAVNYRGSTGRGREFVEELIGDWGGAEQGDVVTGAEHVLAEYDFLDEDRVVVFGGSYGGYSAYWEMVQYPEFFDAGIAWIGLTDLVDMYENTMPHYRTELMEKYLGTPEEEPILYEERSPVTHVENVDGPLFLVHGVNDRRVPVSQARIFRDALDEAGYEGGEDYEYEELGEEGHASSDQEQKLRMFRLLEGFLERRVDDTTTETAADN